MGQWVKVTDFEGRVAEVTWRALKLRTRPAFVILPNNTVSKEAITNYSSRPHR